MPAVALQATRPARAGRVAWGLAAILIAAIIFAQSSRASPSVGSATANDVLSYFAHLGLYGGLAFASARATGARSFRAVLIVAAFVTLYGATDEFHQSFVPSREASLLDFAVDAIGAAAGTIVSAGLVGLARLPRAANSR